MCETGFVGNDNGGYGSVRGDELTERLQSVKHGLRGASGYPDGFGRHCKRVLFILQFVVYSEGDGSFFCHGNPVADNGSDVFGEDFCGTSEFAFGGDCRFGRDMEYALSRSQGGGARYDIDVSGADCCGEHQGEKGQNSSLHR